MSRRAFLSALAAAPIVHQVEPRRVYSFLWDNPLVRVYSWHEVEAHVGGMALDEHEAGCVRQIIRSAKEIGISADRLPVRAEVRQAVALWKAPWADELEGKR